MSNVATERTSRKANGKRKPSIHRRKFTMATATKAELLHVALVGMPPHGDVYGDGAISEMLVAAAGDVEELLNVGGEGGPLDNEKASAVFRFTTRLRVIAELVKREEGKASHG